MCVIALMGIDCNAGMITSPIHAIHSLIHNEADHRVQGVSFEWLIINNRSLLHTHTSTLSPTRRVNNWTPVENVTIREPPSLSCLDSASHYTLKPLFLMGRCQITSFTYVVVFWHILVFIPSVSASFRLLRTHILKHFFRPEPLTILIFSPLRDWPYFCREKRYRHGLVECYNW